MPPLCPQYGQWMPPVCPQYGQWMAPVCPQYAPACPQRVLHAPCAHRGKGSIDTRYHPKASGDHPQAFGNTRQSGLQCASSLRKISRNIRNVPHRARTVQQHPLSTALYAPSMTPVCSYYGLRYALNAPG